jgi:hypothetical protein
VMSEVTKKTKTHFFIKLKYHFTCMQNSKIKRILNLIKYSVGIRLNRICR